MEKRGVEVIDEEIEKLLENTDNLTKEIFESQQKMKNFLLTLSKMYNTSYSNILLLRNQKENVSFIIDKETIEKYGFHIKEGEKPLKIIKRVKVQDEVKFKIAEVFDVSQTDIDKKRENRYSKEYIEIMLKGMCARRGIIFEPNNIMRNIENIVMDIKSNIRSDNLSRYSIDQYASQTQAEVDATIFTVAKNLNINTKNYNLQNICKWGIEKDTKMLKETLKYIQKFTNYFIKDFQTQQKLYNIEKEKQEAEELE